MIVRMSALKNASVTGVTSCDNSTGKDFGAVESGLTAYAALHHLATSTGLLRVRVQSSSSSGFGVGSPGTDRFTFTSCAERRAQWGTPIAGPASTDQPFWRSMWETCLAAGSQPVATGHKFLVELGIQ